MLFEDLKVNITSEDFNLDGDADIQIEEVLLSGDYVNDSVEISSVIATMSIYLRETTTLVNIGDVDLTEVIKNCGDYDNLRVLCENKIEDAYNDYLLNNGPAEDAAESQFEFERGE